MKTLQAISVFGSLGLFLSGCAFEERHASYSTGGAVSPTGISSSPAPVYQSPAPAVSYSESTTELFDPASSPGYVPPARTRVYPAEPVYRSPNYIVGATNPEDRYIADRIASRAIAAGALPPDGPNIRIDVRHGHVHLEGRILSGWQHRTLKDIARSTPGVRGLKDDLKGVRDRD